MQESSTYVQNTIYKFWRNFIRNWKSYSLVTGTWKWTWKQCLKMALDRSCAKDNNSRSFGFASNPWPSKVPSSGSWLRGGISSAASSSVASGLSRLWGSGGSLWTELESLGDGGGKSLSGMCSSWLSWSGSLSSRSSNIGREFESCWSSSW